MSLSLIVLPLFLGCSGSQNPVKIVLPPDFGEKEKPESAANPARFGHNDAEQTSAIESAVKMSQKYAKASAELTELQQKNEQMQSENKQVAEKLKQTQLELDKTKRELDEANDLIMEMRVEINNWKTDVLGFREEMRQADIAQLQTLQKVLEILGGEVTQEIAVADKPDRSPSASTEQNTK
jgi:septal ring factor EnvC (AmiA/AmiB activator)